MRELPAVSGCLADRRHRQFAVGACQQFDALRVRPRGQHHGVVAQFTANARQAFARIRRNEYLYAHVPPPRLSSVLTCTILSAGTSA